MAQFTNQASISYNGNTTNSNIVTGQINQQINAWKNATVDVYREGDIITYVVSIQNSGTTDYTGLTMTANLGEYESEAGMVVPLTYTGDPVLYYSNGVLQNPPETTAGPPLIIEGIDVPAGLSATIVYRVRVNEFAPLGLDASIVNIAELSGDNIPEPIVFEETITASTDPLVTIVKSLNPTTITENEPIVYTFTLQNYGATATSVSTDTGLSLTDSFAPILNAPLAVTLNGTTWLLTGNYTYDALTGEFVTLPGRLVVPAATYAQSPITGIWTATPGQLVLTVSGTI